MKIVKTILKVSLLGCFFVSHYASAADASSVTYKNQRGSMMTLMWHQEKNNTGTLTGTFTTAVGDCKEDLHVPVPLSGYFNGNAVAVTINFPHCKQIVAMTGAITNNQNELHMLWLDVVQSADPQHKDWNSNIIGSDQYKKV